VRLKSAAVGFGLWAVAGTAQSRELEAQSREPRAQSTLQVYHVVIGQGAHYWEKYGHNMLWFYDPANGLDVSYNWGTFDFNSPDFLQRQLVGDPMYSVDTVQGTWVIQAYSRMDRTVTLQRLNLTPVQAERALLFSRRNMLPQNRFYRYDYYRDNCATRVRDVIDFAVGGALKRATATTRVKVSYRGETLRLLDDMPLTQFGTHLALGQPADRLLTVWETMFIPMRMRDALRLVRITGPGGQAVPLVAQERVEYESPRHRDRASVPTLWIPYLIIGLLLGIEFLVVGSIGRRARAADVIFRVETALFALLAGVGGLALLLAWTLTRHVFWFRNENLLLLNPLSLFLAVLALLSIWKPRYARPAAVVAVVTAVLAVVAAAGKFIGFPQNNVALICLFLPPHLAIAWSLWRRQPRAENRPAVVSLPHDGRREP
jgi:hypothetical protein